MPSTGYSVSVLSSNPVPNSIINQTDSVSVTVAENPALAIIDKTATSDVSNPVYIYKQGAAQSGYTVVIDDTVSGQVTYTITKNGAWPSSFQEFTYKPDLTTTDPNVYSTKANLVVKTGESATFALAYLNLTSAPTAFQWKYSADGSTYSNLTDSVGSITGATTRVLSLSTLNAANTGFYKCYVTSSEFTPVFGSNAIDSSVSNLYVIAPEISVDPASPSVGDSVTLSLTGLGSGINDISQYITAYQWKKGNAIVGTNPTLNINSWSAGDAGTYQCIFTVFEDTIESATKVIS